MLDCFSEVLHTDVLPITLVSSNTFPSWLESQLPEVKNWLEATAFTPKAGEVRAIPDPSGKIKQIICGASDQNNFWDVGHLPYLLPMGEYYLASLEHPLHERDAALHTSYAIAWGLGAYQFTRYKKTTRLPAKLYLSTSSTAFVQNIVSSIYLTRDCITTPTDDMGPSEFAVVAHDLAKKYQASCKELVGEALLKENYASIYTVGRASDDAPRLLDLRWGSDTHPKVTLVGKGVCFDSGGLDIKSSQFMTLMKKDMGGAAHVLGLARMIMDAKLPISLRVLMPMVENVISGNAYHPGDVIKTRKGITVEVGNTDAEGRLILADALYEATLEKPDLLIDISTLTGAARIALGPDLPVIFSNNEELAADILAAGVEQKDLMWRLPLYAPYREYLNSSIADINNSSNESYAGAITAALFLKEFVPDDIAWIHFDLMAWNLCSRPGRPVGGEALGLRALFHYLQGKYVIKNKLN